MYLLRSRIFGFRTLGDAVQKSISCAPGIKFVMPKLFSSAAALPRLKTRRADSHKGDYGRALLIGGSPGMAGAIALAGALKMRRNGQIGANDSVLCLVSGGGLNYLNATATGGRVTGPLTLDEIGALDPATIL